MLNEQALKRIERSAEYGEKRYDSPDTWESEALDALQEKLQAHYGKIPQLLFIMRRRCGSYGVHLRLGLSESISETQLKEWQEIANDIANGLERKSCLTLVIEEIPEEGDFLLFDVDQTHAIATHMPCPEYSEFERLEEVYVELLKLVKIHNRADKRFCLKFLTQYASHCAKAGHLKKGLAATEVCAAILLRIIRENEGKEAVPDEFFDELDDDIDNLNYLFTILEAPEIGAQWTQIYLDRIKSNFRSVDEFWIKCLERELDEMQFQVKVIEEKSNVFMLAAQAIKFCA